MVCIRADPDGFTCMEHLTGCAFCALCTACFTVQQQSCTLEQTLQLAPLQAFVRALYPKSFCTFTAKCGTLALQDFVRMLYPNATESNVRQLMSMARDHKATYKVRTESQSLGFLV